MTKLGIIGTAGRGEDGNKLAQKGYWILMYSIAQSVTLMLKDVDTLVSGGAAYSDHLAVQLYLNGYVPQLTLHFPCEFVPSECCFLEEPSNKYHPGKTSNYYHRMFSEVHHTPSLVQIGEAITKGGYTTIGTGFKQRNTTIANDCDVLLAFTFGDKAQLADGGTSDTMNKFLARRAVIPNLLAYHFNLNDKILYSI